MAYLKDISAILGLSVSTVSRALKGYPDISEETRQKVLRTAEELDYHGTKRKTASKSVQYAGAVGVLAPGISDKLGTAYYREMLCAMAEEAAELSRDLVIMGTEPEESGMSWIGRVVLRKIAGICLLIEKEDLYSGNLADLFERGIPLVSIEHEVAGHKTVYSSGRDNAESLLALLKENGHRRTAYIADESGESHRMAVLLAQEAEKLHMTCSEADRGFLGVMGEKEAIEKLKAANATCVIFGSMIEARQSIIGWRNRGYRIPEDLSVAVLDPFCEGMNCEGITFVRNRPGEIGGIAVQKLISIMEHPERDCEERILVTGEISEGKTVADLLKDTEAGAEVASVDIPLENIKYVLKTNENDAPGAEKMCFV